MKNIKLMDIQNNTYNCQIDEQSLDTFSNKNEEKSAAPDESL